jgi:hypothetical protein
MGRYRVIDDSAWTAGSRPAVTSRGEGVVENRKQRLKPSDTPRKRTTDDGVLLDRAAANEADDPFAAFSEWASEADEKAYGSL